MLIHRQNSYAASGGPVAVKRRAVETVNKVKTYRTMANFRSAGQPFQNYFR
jgi:hypothetical protein